MKINNDHFIQLSEKLPEPYTMVFIKRKNHGAIYIGYRRDKPISVNEDPAQDCWWQGEPMYEIPYIQGGVFEFEHSFSDVTVESWMPLNEPFK